MIVQPLTTPAAQTACDALVVPVLADRELAGSAAAVNAAAGGVLERLRESKDLTGKACDLVPLWHLPNVAAPLALAVGLGDADKLDAGVVYRAAAAASRHLAGRKRSRVAMAFDLPPLADYAEAGVCGAVVGAEGQDLYRAEKKRFAPDEILWTSTAGAAIETGGIVGQAVNLARRLVNEPPEAVYPESLAAQAVKVAGECSLAVEVWDEARLKAERCGALLAVARGSARPPRLVILRHNQAADEAPLLALVGKGVTFDSGGLSLKPTDSMLTMKCDMAGAATVLGAMQAIARLKMPIRAVGLMGLVENMPSGTAMKLGDVLKARNGKTIEVQNTDAEGRLVLADVLSVAVDLGAARLIDLATLTGACVVALGTDVAGAMTNDQAWCDQVLASARRAGEAVWQLPMFADYSELIQSDVADIRNTGGTRYGGAITAAKFLEEFVAGKPWTHIDIAGPAFLEKPKPWCDGGATGALVRTLVDVARRWQ